MIVVAKKILQFAQFDPNILIQNKLFLEDLDCEIQPPVTPDPYLNPVKIIYKNVVIYSIVLLTAEGMGGHTWKMNKCCGMIVGFIDGISKALSISRIYNFHDW